MGRNVVGHGVLDVAQLLHYEYMVAVAAHLGLRERLGERKGKEAHEGRRRNTWEEGG